MTKEEILLMIEHQGHPIGLPVNSVVWREAFRVYNESNNKLLSMNCRPCYNKVLHFVINKYWI